MTWITKYMMNIYQGWDNKPKKSCPSISRLMLFKIGHDLLFPTCLEFFNVFIKVNHRIQNNMAVIHDYSTHYHILNIL